MAKQLLIIDNYDSFTYNLLHYVQELGAEVQVVRNDKITVDEALKSGVDGIIISPGPASPNEAGICLELIKQSAGQMPMLGVCLGHQAMGQAFGGAVIRTAPMHGKTSEILHHGQSVFAGLPSPFTATRYHSLMVDKQGFPDCLSITAETADGIIMGLQHRDWPLHGVQFHPESIASEHGHALLQNFLNLL